MQGKLPMLVVLAGGSSSRLWPLRDKSLLSFLGKTLLEHQIQAYTQAGFTEIVIVCNHENITPIQSLIDGSIRQRYPQVRFEFRLQADPRGMGDALLQLKPLAGAFPVYICQVHDVCDPSLLDAMLRSYGGDPSVGWIAGQVRDTYFPGGYLVLDADERISHVIEKPGPGNEPEGRLVSIVAHIHPNFNELLRHIEQEYADTTQTSDDHYERAMSKLMQTSTYRPVRYSGEWYAVKYPWHALEVMDYYLRTITESSIAASARIEDGVNIAGPVVIGENVRIFRGADIRGPAYIGDGSLVGQFAQVRGSMIGSGCEVGLGSEVNRSYVGRGARLHSSKALDTVLADCDAGQHVNLAAGTITANLRADEGQIDLTIKGSRVATGRTKLGAIVGAGTFIGINAALMPGVRIGENCIVGPATIVDRDVPDRHRFFARQETVLKALPGETQQDG